MPVQDVLHLGAVHVLAAGDDHVLRPVDEVDVALVVHVAEVAGAVPPVDERGGRLLGLVPVADHDVGAADERPRRPRRPAAGVPSGADDLDLDADRGLAARAGPRRVEQVLLAADRRGDRRRLGGAVQVLELGVRERLVGPPQRLGRDRRPAVADRPQAADVARAGQLLLAHRGQHRRHDQACRSPRGARSRSRAAAGSNAGSTTWRPACHTVASTAIEPAAWNSGADDQPARLRPERSERLVVEGVGDEVAVGEHHALRRARSCRPCRRARRACPRAGRRASRPGRCRRAAARSRRRGR